MHTAPPVDSPVTIDRADSAFLDGGASLTQQASLNYACVHFPTLHTRSYEHVEVGQ